VRSEPIARPIHHAYVHFPFCARKCPYCDFNSHAGRDGETDAYIEALLAEAEAYAHCARPRTLFVGGGTPTHCDAAQLERYLDGLRRTLGDEELVEFTVEANPGSVDVDKVRAMRRAGVNRVSLGAQSFDEAHLKSLGRIHAAEDTLRSADILRDGGMEHLSLDLILAVPRQTLAEQARDLEQVIAIDPEHVSAYILTYEPDTVFTRAMEAGRLPAPVDERDLAHLHMACAHLEAAGYARYEISNFARPGAESLHNLAYWRNADWLGLGAGAHAHVAGRRWKSGPRRADRTAWRGLAGDPSPRAGRARVTRFDRARRCASASDRSGPRRGEHRDRRLPTRVIAPNRSAHPCIRRRPARAGTGRGGCPPAGDRSCA